LSHSISRVSRLARRALAYELWNVGVVPQSAADIVARGIVAPVHWLPEPGPLQMLADPACAPEPDGGLSLYAEHLDFRRPRGAIWKASIPAGGSPMDATFAPLLDGPHHLSYPMPFQDQHGNRWLCAESWQSREVPVWRQTAGALVPAEPWLPGLAAVDPTVVRHEGNWYLFCTFQDEGPDERLYAFWAAELDGRWAPLPGNPVRTGLAGSRPAGPIFQVGSDLVRPAQDCSVAYGGGLILNRIVQLTPQGFAEEELRRIDPIPGRFANGIHTFSPAGAYTIIDGRRRQVDLLKPLRRARRLLVST
jgi:hypothetical protein